MVDLLASVLDAHGGVDRWARVDTITARLSIGGPFWGRKGWPEIFGDQTTLEFDARRQHKAAARIAAVDPETARQIARSSDVSRVGPVNHGHHAHRREGQPDTWKDVCNFGIGSGQSNHAKERETRDD
jgi:hypothetical protein